jgi:hypothetical protein
MYKFFNKSSVRDGRSEGRDTVEKKGILAVILNNDDVLIMGIAVIYHVLIRPLFFQGKVVYLLCAAARKESN